MAPQIRSGLRAFHDMMVKHKSKFPPSTFDLLRQTPFRHIIEAFEKELLSVGDFSKSSDDIQRMPVFWSPRDAAFSIGGGIYGITLVDVKNIFGLENAGIVHNLELKIERPKNQFFDKYFGVVDRIKKGVLDAALDTAISLNIARDVAILVVMYLLLTFLFANCSSTLSWTLAKLCVEIEDLHRYAWGYMVLRQLESGLSRNGFSISGCAPLVMYWLADRTQLCQKIAARSSYSVSFVHWRLVDIHEAFENMEDDELAKRLNRKEEKMMKVFKEDLKKNDPFYLEESEEDLDMPSFNIWGMICKEELRQREKEAQENMIHIIESLEEKATQASKNHEVDDETQTLIKKLSEENAKLLKQSEVWWELAGNIQKEKEECDKKIDNLKKKLKAKWRKWNEEENHGHDECEMLIGRLTTKNHRLKTKVKELEMKLEEKNILDSQIALTPDEVEPRKDEEKNENKEEDKENSDNQMIQEDDDLEIYEEVIIGDYMNERREVHNNRSKEQKQNEEHAERSKRKKDKGKKIISPPSLVKNVKRKSRKQKHDSDFEYTTKPKRKLRPRK